MVSETANKSEQLNIGEIGDSVLMLKQELPALFCGLNVAQYRALKTTYTRNPENGQFPAINIISFANGVGKTHLMILDMIGWTLGPEYLNWSVFPKCAIDYYASLADLRDKGLLTLRLTCVSDDMKASGSVYMLLKELFPFASISAMDNNKCYRQIDVPHPTKSGVVNSIAVKTFDQDVVKHSGSTCQRVWINEPLPDNLVGETIGRIRSKKGSTSGSICMFATLLDGATWVSEFDADGDIMGVNHERGHIFENCAGEDVTDAMAAEVKQTIGVTLIKNPQGSGYITNGVLSKEQIDRQVKSWMKSCPHELEARKSGAPISGGGKIWPSFKREFHVIENEHFKINPQWPIVQIADPHGARPTFSAWAQITPHDRVIIFQEWPDVDGHGYYETLDERSYTIPQECEIWDGIEKQWSLNNSNIIRLGDPNRFRDNNPYSNETLHAQYAKHGYDFDLSVNDNLTVGHEKVSEYLYCDEMRLTANPNDIMALPRLFICRRCVNVARAVENYAMKKGRKVGASVTENVNQKFKDGADVVRYLIMWHSGNLFASVSATGRNLLSDYEKFCNGRKPKAYRYSNDELNMKGRRVA